MRKDVFMRDGESKEDVIRELKDDIEYLEWEIESKQQELKERLLGMRRMAASTSRKSQTSREDGHSLTIMV